jgi:hypothetical protein
VIGNLMEIPAIGPRAEWTPRFRHIAAILAELPVKTAYVDGEIAVLTAEGVSDFAALQEALGAVIAARARWPTSPIERGHVGEQPRLGPGTGFQIGGR